jgi:hypothetical protein
MLVTSNDALMSMRAYTSILLDGAEWIVGVAARSRVPAPCFPTLTGCIAVGDVLRRVGSSLTSRKSPCLFRPNYALFGDKV